MESTECTNCIGEKEMLEYDQPSADWDVTFSTMLQAPLLWRRVGMGGRNWNHSQKHNWVKQRSTISLLKDLTTPFNQTNKCSEWKTKFGRSLLNIRNIITHNVWKVRTNILKTDWIWSVRLRIWASNKKNLSLVVNEFSDKCILYYLSQLLRKISRNIDNISLLIANRYYSRKFQRNLLFKLIRITTVMKRLRSWAFNM